MVIGKYIETSKINTGFYKPLKTDWKMIFTEKASDYKIVDVILKVWIAGLLGLFVLGMISIIYGIISGEADVQNATFGIFDTLG